MSAPNKINFKIYQGSTFNEVVRWESDTTVFKPITAITKAAPAVITAVGHGLTPGWRFWVSSVLGMKEINSDDPYLAKTITTDSIEVKELNSLLFTAYTSGGVVKYYAPTDLSGYTARLQIREKITSTATILSLTTENGGIALDNTAKTITLNISATATALLDFTSGVYSLEMVSAGGVVTQLLTGNISLVKEITR